MENNKAEKQIFEKPIQEINYLERKGDVKLINKIRSYERK